MKKTGIKIKKKKSLKHIKYVLLISAVMVVLIINFIMAIKISQYDSILNIKIKEINSVDIKLQEKDCPETVAGNEESIFKIKYFYSDFCGYCKKQEPILIELLKEKGDLFYIEFFNIDYCGKEFIDYGAIRVPTFVFKSGDFDEIIHPSFVYKKDLKNLICKANGVC